MSREPAKIVEKKTITSEIGCQRAFNIDDFERLLACAEKAKDEALEERRDRLEDIRFEYKAKCRNDLLREIQKLDFAMVEAKHFLNTHPNDKRAMMYFDRHQKLHKIATEVYEEHFGPLTTDGINTVKDGWRWIDSPWPWQMEV